MFTILMLGAASVCLILTILVVMRIKFIGIAERRASEKVYAIETFAPDIVGYPKVPI